MKSFDLTKIVLLFATALTGCTEETLNQQPLRISQIQSHRPNTAPEPHFYANKLISYNDAGKVSSVLLESYITNTTTTITHTYADDTVTVTNVSNPNGIALMQFIYEAGVLSRYIGIRPEGAIQLSDTLDFLYESNKLVGLDHQGIAYTIEWDENGNIVRITSDEGIYDEYIFEYDNAPNPLQALGLDPLVVILTNNSGEHPLYMPYFVQLFSSNNVTRMQFPFNDDWTWEYEYNSAGLPDKFIWFNGHVEKWKYEPVQ